MFGQTTTLEQMVSKVQRLCFTNQEGVTMSNQITQSTPLWKQGKYPGMEFCASWSEIRKRRPRDIQGITSSCSDRGARF